MAEGSEATGKAKWPHDSSRPMSKRVKDAINGGDIDELKRSLTVRQRHFAEEYVVDFNQTAAAIRAGYSPSYADRQAHILTRHEGVAAYIDYLSQSKEAKITAIDPDYVIAQVTQIISKENTKDGDKLRALELLARHLGMFIDRTEITGKDGGAIQTEEVRQEANDFARQIKSMIEKKDLKVVEGGKK